MKLPFTKILLEIWHHLKKCYIDSARRIRTIIQDYENRGILDFLHIICNFRMKQSWLRLLLYLRDILASWVFLVNKKRHTFA